MIIRLIVRRNSAFVMVLGDEATADAAAAEAASAGVDSGHGDPLEVGDGCQQVVTVLLGVGVDRQ